MYDAGIGGRPRIGILADREGWAYDIAAKELQKHLSDKYDIKIYYVRNRDRLDARDFDLLHVCFWGEEYHTRFNIPREKVVKEISSHRWQYEKIYGCISPEDFRATFLHNASFFAATSLRLKNLLAPYLPTIKHVKNGFDPEIFYPPDSAPAGELRIMWAGNAADPVKGVSDILLPAAGDYQLYLAEGNIPHGQLGAAYRKHDIIVVCSEHEAGPLPLIEGMACGCFPVCCDVGIVPELIRHKQNGYIVQERSIQAFRKAFQWCDEHREHIRQERNNISQSVRDRAWKTCVATYDMLWESALRELYSPVFRNDDVSPDTNLRLFREFCQIFHDRGFTQIHAVTLSGHCNVLHEYGGLACEYDGVPPICFLRNADIGKLSAPYPIEDNQELIAFLAASPDELAFHGTAHFDFSQMNEAELRHEFAEGLARMRKLFPDKNISYFVPPFNRTNSLVERVASEFSLRTLKTDGVHLEEKLSEIDHFEHLQYRYHHHRFYPETRFSCYPLTLERLQHALSHPVAFGSGGERHPVQAGMSRVIHKLGRGLRKVCRRIIPSRGKEPASAPLPMREINSIIDACAAPEWHKYAFQQLGNRAFTHDLLGWIAATLPQNAAILELGCGCGQNLFALQKKNFSNLSGVDVDKNALCVARAIEKKVAAELKLTEGDIFSVDFSQLFDMIYSLDVIYLQDTYDFAHVIKKYSKYLHEGGCLAFDVIDSAYNSIQNNEYLTSDWQKPVEERRESEYKLRTSYSSIVQAAGASGLRILSHKFYAETPQRSVYILKKDK